MDKLLKNKKLLLEGIAVLAVIIIIVIVLVVSNKKNSNSNNGDKANENGVGNQAIQISNTDNAYASKFLIKDGNLYLSENDESSILEGVKGLFRVEWNNKEYVYASLENGRFYYINNLKDSKQSELAFTDLGDYSNIVNIRTTENDVLAVNDKGEELSLLNYIDVYTGYEELVIDETPTEPTEPAEENTDTTPAENTETPTE